MKEHYVSFECAQILKRLGFKEEVTHYYKPEDTPNGQAWLTFSFTAYDHNRQPLKGVIPKYSAPRLDQAAAWLRDCKGIDIEVVALLDPFKKTKRYKTNLCYFSKDESAEDYANYKVACLNIHSYEKALELGISNALELLGKEGKE